MPSGPGVIAEQIIAEIAKSIPPPIFSFLLTCKQNVNDIIEQHKRCRTSCIQLCDRLIEGTHTELKSALPGVSIVQVIHVCGPESVNEAVTAAPFVDAILLDSGNPARAIKELGGTGRVHNWTLSREIRDLIDVPVFLAGGLSSENVQAAIREVAPFALDVCSGVRVNGKLNQGKLTDFFAAINACSSLLEAVDNHP
jgi:phosphoribosylanthranilate isomerase